MDARDHRPAAGLRYPAHALGGQPGEEQKVGAGFDIGGAPLRRFRLALPDGNGVAAGDDHHSALPGVHRRPQLVLHVVGLDQDAAFPEVLRLHVVLDHHRREPRALVAPDGAGHRERAPAPVVGVGEDGNRHAVGDPRGHVDQLGDRSEPVVGDAKVRGRAGASAVEHGLEPHVNDEARRDHVKRAGADHRLAGGEHRAELVARIQRGVGARRSARHARRAGTEARAPGGPQGRPAGSGRDPPERFTAAHSVLRSCGHSVSP